MNVWSLPTPAWYLCHCFHLLVYRVGGVWRTQTCFPVIIWESGGACSRMAYTCSCGACRLSGSSKRTNSLVRCITCRVAPHSLLSDQDLHLQRCSRAFSPNSFHLESMLWRIWSCMFCLLPSVSVTATCKLPHVLPLCTLWIWWSPRWHLPQMPLTWIFLVSCRHSQDPDSGLQCALQEVNDLNIQDLIIVG